MTTPLAPLASLDLAPFPARAAGDAVRAYQPQAPALVQMFSGRVHRIDVVQVFADGAIIVETVRQRAHGGGDYLRAARPRWALHTLERYMRPGDAQILRDAITAAELDYTMRVQMATDPERGGPRDPELPPVVAPTEHRVAFLNTGTALHAAAPGTSLATEVGASASTLCGLEGYLGSGWFERALTFVSTQRKACPACVAHMGHRRDDSGASVAEIGGRMVFTLTQGGLRRLAEGLGTTPEHFSEVARRSGWQVEES